MAVSNRLASHEVAELELVTIDWDRGRGRRHRSTYDARMLSGHAADPGIVHHRGDKGDQKMSTSTGLTRLGTLLKLLGCICLALAASATFLGPAGIAGGSLFGVPGAGLWGVGWAVQGLGKA